MKKTTYRFDWVNGYTTAKRLSRSFNTIEEAVAFAEGRQAADIYKTNGKYKVEWIKVKGANNG